MKMISVSRLSQTVSCTLDSKKSRELRRRGKQRKRRGYNIKRRG